MTPNTATFPSGPTSTWSSRPHRSFSRAAGKHVLSCFVQYAPLQTKPGLNWDDQKEAFGDAVVNTIAEYAPNIKNIILAAKSYASRYRARALA